jgi:hypothetical protein
LDSELQAIEGHALLTENEERIMEYLENTIFTFGYLAAFLILLIYNSTQIPFIRPLPKRPS